jgi:hypothetical protein
MSRALFLGDSHTCGYVTVPGKQGPGSYEMWQDNNYAESYARQHNKQTAIYAVPGSCNRVYPDWLRTMLDTHPDIDEVFVLLSSWNRFILAFNEKLSPDVLPVDYFTKHILNKDNLVDVYQDELFKGDRFQLYNKPTWEDFSSGASVSFNYDNALVDPDIRKDTFMKVKLFFDLNTHLEQRDFFKDVYAMDNMCHDHGCKLYFFNMTERMKFPQSFEFYGKLKATKLAPMTVESYFRSKFVDHTKFYISDGEHYNKDYHDMIASRYLEWLKSV